MDFYEKKKNKKLTVAIFFGGRSSEHEISLLSSKNVIKEIDREKYELILIGINKTGQWILCEENNYLVHDENPLKIALIQNKNFISITPGINNNNQFFLLNTKKKLPYVHVAVLVLHGSYGENGSIQGLLNMLGIPFTGSDVLGSSVCMDKDITKRILRDSGIQVTPSMTLFRNDYLKNINFDFIVSTLGLPLFIKPSCQGSSIGVNKITNRETFYKSLEIAFNYDYKILVEKEILGREIEIAVIGNKNPKTSVCGEILVEDKFYSYKEKYLHINSFSKTIIPAKLKFNLLQLMKKIAKKSYLLLGCSVMARIDFFLTNDNFILLNEVNTLPGFTSISMYPRLWNESGLNYKKLLDQLINYAIDRK